MGFNIFHFIISITANSGLPFYYSYRVPANKLYNKSCPLDSTLDYHLFDLYMVVVIGFSPSWALTHARCKPE